MEEAETRAAEARSVGSSAAAVLRGLLTTEVDLSIPVDAALSSDCGGAAAAEVETSAGCRVLDSTISGSEGEWSGSKLALVIARRGPAQGHYSGKLESERRRCDITPAGEFCVSVVRIA